MYWGYIGAILGLYWGYMGVNGKENGNCYNGLYRVEVELEIARGTVDVGSPRKS